MELNLAEIERLSGVSRYQISRYANDGRLTRTRQGYYDAASLANLADRFDPYAVHGGQFIDEERAVYLVRAEYAFRRSLLAVMQRRYEDGGRRWGPVELTPEQRHEIERAVKAYVAILAGRKT